MTKIANTAHTHSQHVAAYWEHRSAHLPARANHYPRPSLAAAVRAASEGDLQPLNTYPLAGVDFDTLTIVACADRMATVIEQQANELRKLKATLQAEQCYLTPFAMDTQKALMQAVYDALEAAGLSPLELFVTERLQDNHGYGLQEALDACREQGMASAAGDEIDEMSLWEEIGQDE